MYCRCMEMIVTERSGRTTACNADLVCYSRKVHASMEFRSFLSFANLMVVSSSSFTEPCPVRTSTQQLNPVLFINILASLLKNGDPRIVEVEPVCVHPHHSNSHNLLTRVVQTHASCKKPPFLCL